MILSPKVHLILKEGAPWLILTAYMLLPPLYAQEWTCRLQKSALWIFLATSFSLGHVLVIVHYIAMAGEVPDPALVLVRPLQASLFGLFSIPFNVWSSFNHSWNPVSAAGVGIGAASVLLYGALWAKERYCGSIQAEVYSQEQEDDEASIWRRIQMADGKLSNDESYKVEISNLCIGNAQSFV